MPKTKTTKIATAKKTAPAKPKKSSGGAITIFNAQGKEVGSVDMPQHIKGAAGSDALVSQAVRVYMSRQQIGVKHAKTRAEVSGSTRKIYRQKGTGNARHGSRKAPIFKGGGVAHGPQAMDQHLEIPKAMRRNALFTVLSQRAKSGNISVVEGLESVTGKTKEMAALLSHLHLSGEPSTLVVLGDKEQLMYRAGKNIPRVTCIPVRQLNAYTVLAHAKMVVTKSAMNLLSSI